jgi:predicted nucleic acid-binding protein
LIAVDTSVVIAAFASWHEGHEASAAVCAKRPRVPAHVLIEAYSVATRLPPPHRVLPSLIAAFLRETFRDAPILLPPGEHARFVQEAAGLEISGGGIYDGLVAATARDAGARLFTRDRRAIPIYERLRADYVIVD